MWFIVVCTLIDKEYASLLFSQTFFHIVSVCWASFQKFWKESLTRTSSHLHNAAHALSSPSRCFQLSTNLGEEFFCNLWYCGKKQIECGLVWHWWNSTDLGSVNWHVFKQSECRNCCLYNHATSEIWKYFQIWFSPDLVEKMAAFWACACKLSWTLFSRYRGREERRVQGLNYLRLWLKTLTSTLIIPGHHKNLIQ